MPLINCQLTTYPSIIIPHGLNWKVVYDLSQCPFCLPCDFQVEDDFHSGQSQRFVSRRDRLVAMTLSYSSLVTTSLVSERVAMVRWFFPIRCTFIIDNIFWEVSVVIWAGWGFVRYPSNTPLPCTLSEILYSIRSVNPIRLLERVLNYYWRLPPSYTTPLWPIVICIYRRVSEIKYHLSIFLSLCLQRLVGNCASSSVFI